MFLTTLFTKLLNVATDIVVVNWDILLVLYNLVTPKLAVGHVIPEGHPGAGGKWPEFVPAGEGDSRCSCPALNAMANHGILPHDGRNIKFTELNHKINETYRFAPTFCFFVPNFAAKMLKKNYSKDTFDLSDLDLHNGIEHDASLCREDAAVEPDQSKPAKHLIEALLASATGKSKDGAALITAADLSRYMGQRRVDARATNPESEQSLFHKIFGASNSSTMLTIFGGEIKDLTLMLLEERIPENWEPRIRQRAGLTMGAFNATVLKVAMGVKEPATASTAAIQTATSGMPPKLAAAPTERSPLL